LYVFSWAVVSGVVPSLVVGDGTGVFVSPVILAVVLIRAVAEPIDVEPFRDAEDPPEGSAKSEDDLVLTRGESVTTVPGIEVVVLDERDDDVDGIEVDVLLTLLTV
jgi:hypothetical protein